MVVRSIETKNPSWPLCPLAEHIAPYRAPKAGDLENTDQDEITPTTNFKSKPTSPVLVTHLPRSHPRDGRNHAHSPALNSTEKVWVFENINGKV